MVANLAMIPCAGMGQPQRRRISRPTSKRRSTHSQLRKKKVGRDSMGRILCACRLREHVDTCTFRKVYTYSCTFRRKIVNLYRNLRHFQTFSEGVLTSYVTPYQYSCLYAKITNAAPSRHWFLPLPITILFKDCWIICVQPETTLQKYSLCRVSRVWPHAYEEPVRHVSHGSGPAMHWQREDRWHPNNINVTENLDICRIVV